MKAMTDILVDELGRTWQPNSYELRQHCGNWRGNIDLSRYLVQNAGFARVRSTASVVRITFRPMWLTPKSIATIITHMFSSTRARYIIELTAPAIWQELVTDTEDAVSRLIQLGDGSNTLTRPSFFVQPLSLSRLRQPDLPPRLLPLRSIHRTWRANKSLEDAMAKHRASSPWASNRTILTRMRPNSAVVERVGDGYSTFEQTWAESMVGRGVEDLPDPDYGGRAAASYFETHAAAEPQLELVEADVRLPGRPPVRIRYERLLLPWVVAGASFVSSSSVVRMSRPALEVV